MIVGQGKQNKEACPHSEKGMLGNGVQELKDFNMMPGYTAGVGQLQTGQVQAETNITNLTRFPVFSDCRCTGRIVGNGKGSKYMVDI